VRAERVQQLVELLPVDPERQPTPLPGAQVLPFRTPLDRLVNCGSTKSDFGWKIVRMFIDAKLDLPIAIHDPPLVRANWYLRTDCHDDSMRTVLYVAHPQSYQRDLLNAYLLCDDISLESISQRMRLPVGVIKLYSDLFFNVREHCDEAYLAGIVFPESRMPQLLGKKFNLPAGEVMLQLAYDYGVEELEKFAFPNRNRSQGESRASLGQALERKIFFDAAILAQMGGLNDSRMPVIKLAQELICGKKSAVADEWRALRKPARGPAPPRIRSVSRYA
jgi:hypothetical protein